MITDTLTRRREVLGGPVVPGGNEGNNSGNSSGTNTSSVFTVVKCGASGHNIRSEASLKAPPVGMLVLGNVVVIDKTLQNADGSYIVFLQ